MLLLRLTVIATRVDGQFNVFVNFSVFAWNRLCAADDTGLCRVTDVELVVVRGERLQPCGLKLPTQSRYFKVNWY